MSSQFKFILSLSIFFPAIIALFRLGSRYRIHRPFLILVFVGLFNELLVGLYVTKLSFEIRSIAWQLYNLIECVILLVQFSHWGTFKKHHRIFNFLLLITVTGWVLENFILSNITEFNFFFLIGYSFMFVILSIYMITHIFSQHPKMPVSNGVFIICVGMIIFFLNTSLVFLFLLKYMYDERGMPEILSTRAYINASVNIIFAIGIYCVRGTVTESFAKTRDGSNI